MRGNETFSPWRYTTHKVAAARITRILDALESLYGVLHAQAPTDPYEFLIWWHCGYPASEERCWKGWQSLIDHIGIAPGQLIAASSAKLAKVLKAGGMVPEVRAVRIKEIAARVQGEYGNDLRCALSQLAAPDARKVLKTFPGIGNPGADRIALFSRLAPVAAVPSACPHVLVRIVHGTEGIQYTADYAAAQRILDALPATYEARIRGYLLVARHARELCKRNTPACGRCPLESDCAFANRAEK